MATNYDVNTKEATAICEYSVLVVGYAGVGKSAFCNFLTRTKLFNEFEGLFGEDANEINKQQCKVLETKLTIIDYPGFGDTEKTLEQYFTGLETYLNPQPHSISIDIIILVVNLTKRFSQEESELFLNMSKTMGSFGEKTICVFTHAAYFEKNFKAKKTDSSCEAKFDYIEFLNNTSKNSQELKELLNTVQDRYLWIETVDKAGDDKYWTANVTKLLKYFKEIRENWDERAKKMEKMERGEEIKKKTEQMKLEEKIVKKTESKEEIDLMKCSTEESMPENHHKKESETIITSKDQNEMIALRADNPELKEKVIYENQQSRIDAQPKEIKEGQTKKYEINCIHL